MALGILKIFRGREPKKSDADKALVDEEKKRIAEKEEKSKAQKKVAKKPAITLPKDPDEKLFSDDAKNISFSEAAIVAGHKKYVGEFLEIETLDNVTVVHKYASNLRAYPDWHFEIILNLIPGDKITITDSELIPNQDAFLSPEWISFAERLKPTDIGEKDELDYEADDMRLEDYVETVTRLKELGPEDLKNVAITKNRVLNAYGKQDLAARWYDGLHGPHTASTRIAKERCNSCAFYIGLSGDLGQIFGVCANAWSRDDGKVVSLNHGCGMHSETPASRHDKRLDKPALVLDQTDSFDLVQDIEDTSN